MPRIGRILIGFIRGGSLARDLQELFILMILIIMIGLILRLLILRLQELFILFPSHVLLLLADTPVRFTATPSRAEPATARPFAAMTVVRRVLVVIFGISLQPWAWCWLIRHDAAWDSQWDSLAHNMTQNSLSQNGYGWMLLLLLLFR